jgi:hypothetical protein
MEKSVGVSDGFRITSDTLAPLEDQQLGNADNGKLSQARLKSATTRNQDSTDD